MDATDGSQHEGDMAPAAPAPARQGAPWGVWLVTLVALGVGGVALRATWHWSAVGAGERFLRGATQGAAAALTAVAVAFAVLATVQAVRLRRQQRPA